MGQKTNPIGNRLGIIRGWDSNWFGGNDYGDKIAEDYKIRRYLNARLSKANLSRIYIDRTLKLVTVTITTSKPGLIIGKGGQEVDKLKEELKKLTGKEVQINIHEIRRPELDAVLVADNIARQIENRISYRRAVKMAIAGSMRVGAEGIKVQISGRLNGAEMARSESFKEGRIPLSTFRADIDYHISEAHTTYGRLGVKVWIMKGEVYGNEVSLEQYLTYTTEKPEKSAVEYYARAIGSYDEALEKIVADLKRIKAPLDNLVPLINLYKKPIDEKVLEYYNHIKRKHKGENPIKIIQEKIAEIHSDLEKKHSDKRLLEAEKEKSFEQLLNTV